MTQVAFALFVVGMVMLIGWGRSTKFPTCKCGTPIGGAPGIGYWAYHDGKPICKACGTRQRIPPWYAKQWQIDRWQETRWEDAVHEVCRPGRGDKRDGSMRAGNVRGLMWSSQP